MAEWKVMPISRCRACGCNDLRRFLDFGQQPLANGFVDKQGEAVSTYPLSLSWCPHCTLVQLDHTINPRTLFSDYLWVTSTSSTARCHAKNLCKTILSKIQGCENLSYVLEIGSNDGTFLRPFADYGCDVLGIDPADNVVRMAIAGGIRSKCRFFDTKTAEETISDHGFPGVVMARNVLPHVAKLHDVLNGIKTCLSKDSLLVAEVHYAKTILEELHYDSVYHEHLCYFTVKSLKHLFSMYGLKIWDIAPSPISGGSIVVFASPYERREEASVLEYEQSENRLGINEFYRWYGFSEKVLEHRRLLWNIFKAEQNDGRRVIGYGASARSSTMLNFCGVGSGQVRAIADRNAMKHGLLSPGANIPIGSPETVMAEDPDTVAILAWNFLEEIAKDLWHGFGFRERVIIPLPHPPRVEGIGDIIHG